MPVVPETGPAISVVRKLVADFRLALTDPPSPERCRELLIALDAVHQDLDWCGGAVLELTRRTDPVMTWKEVQRVTGIADSTLNDRYHRWRQNEGGAR